MNRRREPCRNFQRGSCQYGDHCKFLHLNPQQSKSNPFGFGSQSPVQFPQSSQQPKPNPFGFGVQNASQLNGAANFNVRGQNSSKPFENKWIRPTTSGNSVPSQQTDAQKQSAVHTCTDPESCKHQIVEDFKNEAPLWKLTCYGHWKYLPCDIVGDISYEELRAAAYEDAKRGLQLQSIVERERNLLKSKLSEFDKLLKNLHIKRNVSSEVNQFPVNNNTFIANTQSYKPPTFSSFSQLGTSANVPSNKSFGSLLTGGTSNTGFGQPLFHGDNNQNSGGQEIKFGASGPSTSSIINATGSQGFQLNSISAQLVSSHFNQSQGQFVTGSNSQLPGFLDGAKLDEAAINQAPAGDKQDIGVDDSIWLKDWDIGEIPEQAPPERVCV
ncbi:hypothetical protein HPP92_017373 [Vanilla planifolia]|uniref:C3H1-type domain-containing protein n=1 Tax=Vanilla planifolia TaxID=51239 RepID=A0A835QL83_VANPL|nr:hypothetical protein HPP92_017373 [Vanilla planifolia]